MKIKIIKSNILILISVLIMYLFIKRMLNIFKFNVSFFNFIPSASIEVFITIIALLSLIILILLKRVDKKIVPIIIFSIYIIIAFIINRKNVDSNFFLNLSFWFSIFILGFSLLKEKKDFSKIGEFIGILSIVLSLIYIYGKIRGSYTSYVFSVNSAYYILFSIPFVFLIKNKVIRLVALIISSIGMLISCKLTLIIAYIIVLLVNLFFRKKFSAGKIFLISFSIVVFLISYYFVVKYLNIDFLNQFAEARETGGSGRFTIYNKLFELYGDFDLKSKIFGKGPDSCSLLIGLGAHNDFLEILIDYGFVGLMLYLGMYYSLFKQLFACKNDIYYYEYLSSLIIFFIVSIGSNIIFVPTYFIYVSLFWGMYFQYTKKEVMDK